MALSRSADEPVPEPILAELRRGFPDFVRAHDERGMRPEEFERYGASVATLAQFEQGYRRLLGRVARLRGGPEEAHREAGRSEAP